MDDTIHFSRSALEEALFNHAMSTTTGSVIGEGPRRHDVRRRNHGGTGAGNRSRCPLRPRAQRGARSLQPSRSPAAAPKRATGCDPARPATHGAAETPWTPAEVGRADRVGSRSAPARSATADPRLRSGPGPFRAGIRADTDAAATRHAARADPADCGGASDTAAASVRRAMKPEILEYIRAYENARNLKPTDWRGADEVDPRSDVPIHAKPSDRHPRVVRPRKKGKK